MSLLLVDHHDSFTYNLWQLVSALGESCDVVLADAVDLDAIARRRPAGIILSPGPCTPNEAGVSPSIVASAASGRLPVPVLGVCLGHQVIAAALGATVRRAAAPRHGVALPVRHDGRGIFTGIPSPMLQAHYNSLVVDAATLPPELEACAFGEGDEVMALRHRDRPLDGVQFHPESFLSEHGNALVARWLELRVARAHRVS